MRLAQKSGKNLKNVPPRRDRRLPRSPHGLQSPQRHQAVSGEKARKINKKLFPSLFLPGWGVPWQASEERARTCLQSMNKIRNVIV